MHAVNVVSSKYMRSIKSHVIPFRGHRSNRQANKRRDRKSFLTSERQGILTSNVVHGWSMTTRITDTRGDLKGQGLLRDLVSLTRVLFVHNSTKEYKYKWSSSTKITLIILHCNASRIMYRHLRHLLYKNASFVIVILLLIRWKHLLWR